MRPLGADWLGDQRLKPPAWMPRLLAELHGGPMRGPRTTVELSVDRKPRAIVKMFKPIIQDAILNFIHEDEAATAVEYAVMLALIIAVCMASVTFLADSTRDSFNSSGAAISGAWGN